MASNYYFLNFLTSILLVTPLAAIEIEKTNCEKLWVSNYEYDKFYDLSQLKCDQSDDYFAKLPITFQSDNGDIHIAFSESTETQNANRVYEFLLGGYGNTVYEIRRKDYLYEKRNFNGNRFADNRVPTYREYDVELSISKSGIVQIVEPDTQFNFNLTDQLPVIPVKYVSFAGYRGSRSKVTFDCVYVTNAVDATSTESLPEPSVEGASTTESLVTGIYVDSTIRVENGDNGSNEITRNEIDSTTLYSQLF